MQCEGVELARLVDDVVAGRLASQQLETRTFDALPEAIERINRGQIGRKNRRSHLRLLIPSVMQERNMKILVTGSTGTVGSEVIRQLVSRGASVLALTRSPEKAKFATGVEAVKGDMLDTTSMRAALKGVSTLFLLNTVAPDELTQALITLNLAREAGVQNLVYLSVIHADRFSDVPHFAGKAAVERMIADIGMKATILRPGYYMQNDATLKDALLGGGVYPMPLGTAGTLMVDTRDLAEVAAIDLMRRDVSIGPLPTETIDLVDPEVLSGPGIADIWSQLLGRTVTYGGDDLAALEKSLQQSMPSWMAYDMRLMMRRFQEDGMSSDAANDVKLRERLGRPMRTYRAFAAETATAWKEA